MSTNENPEPVVETEEYSETTTNDVELDLDDGEIQAVVVTATYETGKRTVDDDIIDENVHEYIRASVEFQIEGGEAHLAGFYPDTTATGRELYRETFKSLVVLDHAADVVADYAPDDVRVAKNLVTDDVADALEGEF